MKVKKKEICEICGKKGQVLIVFGDKLCFACHTLIARLYREWRYGMKEVQKNKGDVASLEAETMSCTPIMNDDFSKLDTTTQVVWSMMQRCCGGCKWFDTGKPYGVRIHCKSPKTAYSKDIALYAHILRGGCSWKEEGSYVETAELKTEN